VTCGPAWTRWWESVIGRVNLRVVGTKEPRKLVVSIAAKATKVVFLNQIEI
jgi:hypothetical protein